MERKRDEERRKKVKDYLRSVRLFTNQNSIWQIQNVGNSMCVCVCEHKKYQLSIGSPKSERLLFFHSLKNAKPQQRSIK